jgi:hypothetical protein
MVYIALQKDVDLCCGAAYKQAMLEPGSFLPVTGGARASPFLFVTGPAFVK